MKMGGVLLIMRLSYRMMVSQIERAYESFIVMHAQYFHYERMKILRCRLCRILKKKFLYRI